MNTGHVDVVLLGAKRPANVAAACRAMKNMGLRRLVLVDPPGGLDEPEARALAYGGWDVLDAAVTAGSLGEAVAGSTLVVGTSARAEGAWTPRRLVAEAGARAGSGRVSLVFGPESRGLSNEELALCHVTVRIPTDPAQPSLNLAQAVLVLAYEVFVSEGPSPGPSLDEGRATAGEVEEALSVLGESLLGIGYLNPQNPEAIVAEIRRLVARAGPTPREVALLRGIARQVLWAAHEIARKRGGGG